MCNLSYGIEENAKKEGSEEGIELDTVCNGIFLGYS